MDDALFALLIGAAPVTALTGNRIFWGAAQQGAAPPVLVLNIISGADTPHLTGTDGLWRYRVQIDCYGRDRPAARQLSRAVVGLLNGYQDDSFRGVFLETTRENFEGATVDRPSRISMDFIINWRAP